MPSQYLRPVGKPVVEKATNGLRKVTRRYVVHGPSSNADVVESRVFQAFCTPDEEYTDALLVEQKLEGSQDPSQDILVRVYMEVNDVPAEVDKPDYARDGVGRVRVTKSFIVETPYPDAWTEARVGTETLTTPNNDTCILAKVTFDEKDCYSVYKEEWFQVGIISFKEDIRHNGKLLLRTYRSIGLDTEAEFLAEAGLPTGWTLIQNMSGSGSTDYQFGGLEVKSWVVVKGAGRIVLEEEDAGAAQITTELIIVEDGGDPSAHSSIPPAQVYETRVEDKDGYDLWTLKGVVGQGEIDRKHEFRFNGALEIITIKAVGQQATPPAGFVRVSEEHDQSGRFDVYTDVFVKGLGLISREEEDKGTAQITTEVWVTANGGTPSHTIPPAQVYETRVEEKDGYEIHTISGVVGTGEMDRREETKHNGALSVITIKNIGQQSTPPVGYVRISEALDQSGRFDVYTDVYVKGTGLLSVSEEDKGTAEITTEVWVTENGGTPPHNIPPGQVFETTVEERDGYEVHTVRGVIGSGEIDRRTDYPHNGALELVTIKNIGAQSTVPAGFVRVSEDHDQSGRFDVFTDVYAKGDGLVSSSEEDKGTAQIATEVWITANGGSPAHNIPPSEVFSETVEEKDGYEIHTIRGVKGSGEIDRKTEYRHNGALEVLTIENIGGQSAVPGGFVRVSEKFDQSGNFNIYTDVYVKGRGLVSSTEEDKGTAQIATEVWITENGGTPAHGIPPAEVFSETVEEKDGYEVHTIRGVKGTGEIDRKHEYRHNGALEVVTIKNIGSQSTVPAGYVRISESFDQSGRFNIYTDVYAKGAGMVSSSSEDKGSAQITTEVWLTENGGTAPHNIPQGQIYRNQVEEKDGYEIHTISGVVGQGEIERKTEYRNQGKLEILTIKSIGAQAPNEPNFVRISEEHDQGGNFDVYTDVFAKGVGRIALQKAARSDNTLRETVTYLGTDDGPAPNGCVVDDESSEKDGYTLYRKTYASAVDTTQHSVSSRTDSYGIAYLTARKMGSAPTIAGSVAVTAKRETQIPCTDGGATLIEYEWTFAKLPADLEVSRDVRKSGDLIQTTITQIGSAPTLSGCVTGKSDKDLYDVDGNVFTTVYSRTFTDGSGELERSTSTSGGVTKTRIRYFNQPPTHAGCVVAKSSQASKDINGVDCGTIYDWTFASGSGELERTTSSSNGVTRTRIRAIGAAPTFSGCIVGKSEEVTKDIDGVDCLTIYDYTFAEGTGELERSVETRNGLTRTRIKQLGSAPSANGCLVAKSEEDVKDVDGNLCHKLYDYTFAEGSGELERSVSTSGNITKTRIVSIDQVPTGTGCLVARKSDVHNDVNGASCYTVYDYTYAEGTGELERTVSNTNGITRTRIKNIGAVPTLAGACVVSKGTEKTTDVDGADCLTIYDYEFMSGSGEMERSVENRSGVTYTRIKSFGNAPNGNGCLVTKKEEQVKDADGGVCDTIYDYTYMSGVGEIERSSRSAGGKRYLTVKKYGAVPLDGNCVTAGSDEIVTDANGGICNTIFSRTFLFWTNGVVGKSVAAGADGMTLTTVREVGQQGAGAPQGACSWGEKSEDVYDWDGNICLTEYETTYATAPANGEVGRSVRHTGDLTLTTVTTIGNAAVVPQGACETGNETKDIVDLDGNVCFQKHEVTYAVGNGVVDESVSHGANGEQHTRIRSIGNAAPNGPAGACILSKKEDQLFDVNGAACLKKFDYVFMTGPFGEIGRNVKNLDNGRTITTIKSADAEPQANAGECVVSKESEDILDFDGNKCYTLYTYQFASGQGEVSRTSFTRDKLDYLRIKSVGVSPNPPGNSCLTDKSELTQKDADGSDCLTVYEYTYLTDIYCRDLSRSSETKSNGITLTTVESIDCEPDENGCIVSKSSYDIEGVDGSCTTVYKWTFADGYGEYERTVSNRNGLSYIRIKSIDQAPTNSGCLTDKSEVETKSADGSTCYTIYDYTFLDTSGNKTLKTVTTFKDGVTYTTKKKVGTPWAGTGCKTSEETETIDGVNGTCATIYTTTYATGSGELSRTTSIRDGITYETVKTIGANPTGSGCVVKKNTDNVKGMDGNTCYTVHEWTFASGSGTLSETIKTVCDVEYKTIRTIGTAPAGSGTLLKEEEITHKDVDGSDCYKEYAYTYRTDTGSGSTSEVTLHRSDGSKITRIVAVGDYVEPTGDCTTQKSWVCTDEGKVFTWEKWTKPSAGYSTKATMRYTRLGTIHLDADGAVVVSAPPVNTLVLADVDVTISSSPPSEIPQVQVGSPVYTATMDHANGSSHRSARVYPEYTVDCSETLEVGPLYNRNVRGTPYKVINAKLEGGGVSGDASVIRVSSEPIFKCSDASGGSGTTWFKNTVIRASGVVATPCPGTGSGGSGP